jgi:hypothetical protein
MSSLCYINKDFEAEVIRTRKAIDSLKDIIEVLKFEVDNRIANGEDVETEELDCYEEAMKILVWREFAANDFLSKEKSGQSLEDWCNQEIEQPERNQLEEVEKRILQLEILNAEIETHHARFRSGEAGNYEMDLLTNRALVIQDEMKSIDSRVSELFDFISDDDPGKTELLKKYEAFWELIDTSLSFETRGKQVKISILSL